MPDYTFMRWDEDSFDVNLYSLSKCACQVKKYALAADLCRLNVLAEYGGVYLDTDVELFNRFDDYLNCNFFSAVELYDEFEKENIREKYLNVDGTPKDINVDVPHFEILTSTMGCVPNQKMIVELRDYYNSIQTTPEKALDFHQWLNYDRLFARYCAKNGFRFINETQRFGDNMIVYGTGLFGYKYCPDKRFEVSFHHNAATWRNKEDIPRMETIKMQLNKRGLLFLYHWYRNIKRVIHKSS